jgi:hypothetical protein
VATTLPHQEVRKQLIINEKISCHLNKLEIFEKRIKAGRPLSENLQSNLLDSSFLLHFQLDDHLTDVEVWVKIYPTSLNETIFEIDSLDSYTITGGLFLGIDEDDVGYVNELRKDDLVNLFKKNVVDKIENKNLNDTRIFYDNPKFDYTLKRMRRKP